MEHIIEDIRLTLLDTIKASGAVITSKLNISEIFFSRRKIRSIILNLVTNSIKFKSPERTPEIFIRTIHEGDFVVISIKDNGIGIDAEKQKNIFDKYYRINNAIDGSGIGLHLANKLITDAGGKITIESTLNEGTEFKIYLKEG